jgi:hypothetical protein
MTIRRINHTKRRRIDKQDVTIRLLAPADRPQAFGVSLDLAKHKDNLPADAKIFIEAYRQTTRMRFGFGTVANPGFAAGRALLSDFDDADAVLFAVKVTGVSGSAAGLLLADRDGISPTDGTDTSGREALLPTCSADLGQEMWKLDFQNSTVVLQINSRIPDWKRFAGSRVFKAVAYPAIIRQVLTRIVVVEEWDSEDDSEDWRSKWLLFARSIPRMREVEEKEEVAGVPEDIGGRYEWIEEVAAAFSNNAELLKMYSFS